MQLVLAGFDNACPELNRSGSSTWEPVMPNGRSHHLTDTKRTGFFLGRVGDLSVQQMAAAIRSASGFQAPADVNMNSAVGGLSTSAPSGVYAASVAEISAKLDKFRKKSEYSTTGKRLAETYYKLEKMDPRHRVGHYLLGCFEYYKKHPTNAPFFQWLDAQSQSELKAIMFQNGAGNLSMDEMQDLAAFTTGVQYLNEATRVQYSVEVRGDCLMWQGKALDTGAMSTVRSGPGTAIWVLSPGPTQTFYTNSHTRGRFFHSSFLEGKSVKGAGEWAVENGKLKVISGKTGHYAANCEDLAVSLGVLHQRGVNIMTARVRVFDGIGAEKMLNAWEFATNGELRNAYRTDEMSPMPQGKKPGRNFLVPEGGKYSAGVAPRKDARPR
jgi:hypothetical protein